MVGLKSQAHHFIVIGKTECILAFYDSALADFSKLEVVIILKLIEECSCGYGRNLPDCIFKIRVMQSL